MQPRHERKVPAGAGESLIAFSKRLGKPLYGTLDAGVRVAGKIDGPKAPLPQLFNDLILVKAGQDGTSAVERHRPFIVIAVSVYKIWHTAIGLHPAPAFHALLRVLT